MSKNKNVVPIHGNYHGYYNKRPAIRDPRLAILPCELFQGRRVLDIGCNEGMVTCEIAQARGAARVIGVDIDDTLVRAAWKHRRSVWSQQGPRKHSVESEETDGAAGKRRRLSQSDEQSGSDVQAGASVAAGVPGYFPASCEHMFGPLPIPDATSHSHSGASSAFPHNVSFRTADWVDNEIPEDAEGYDVVIAFSITKWIHLNGGDEGMMTFFRRVHKVLRPGGTFVLEPQEWDTYSKAKRMNQTLKETAKSLKLRPEDFGRVLQEIGFSAANRLGSTGEGGFRRPIDLYERM